MTNGLQFRHIHSWKATGSSARFSLLDAHNLYALVLHEIQPVRLGTLRVQGHRPMAPKPLGDRTAFEGRLGVAAILLISKQFDSLSEGLAGPGGALHRRGGSEGAPTPVRIAQAVSGLAKKLSAGLPVSNSVGMAGDARASFGPSALRYGTPEADRKAYSSAVSRLRACGKESIWQITPVAGFASRTNGGRRGFARALSSHPRKAGLLGRRP